MRFAKTRKSLVAVLAAMTVVLASPAIAYADGSVSYTSTNGAYSGKCIDQWRDFDLPLKSDVRLDVELCLYRHGTKFAFSARISQDGGLGLGSGHRWDALTVTITFEKRANGGGSDQIVGRRTCNIVKNFNDYSSTEKYCPAVDSVSLAYPETPYTSAYDWSLDGWIDYDIDNDGKGSSRWNLTGSPLLF